MEGQDLQTKSSKVDKFLEIIRKKFGSIGNSSYLCSRYPLVCKLHGPVVKEQLKKN